MQTFVLEGMEIDLYPLIVEDRLPLFKSEALPRRSVAYARYACKNSHCWTRLAVSEPGPRAPKGLPSVGDAQRQRPAAYSYAAPARLRQRPAATAEAGP